MTTKTLPYAPGTIENPDSDTRKALIPQYNIIMWNDEVTTMEFVVRILINMFQKDYPTAESLMFEIHSNGMATVATMPLEQAEFKVDQVHMAASMEEFPFICTIEPAS
jgi:ATP-dependent Clp protease adaptor protein ClpS